MGDFLFNTASDVEATCFNLEGDIASLDMLCSTMEKDCPIKPNLNNATPEVLFACSFIKSYLPTYLTILRDMKRTLKDFQSVAETLYAENKKQKTARKA